MTLRNYLAAMEFRHFSPAEVMVNMDNDLNREPPRELWPNIVPTMVVVDAMRAELGVPCRLSSVWRAIPYNQNIGGARRSSHQAFAAADCHFAGVSGYDAADLARSWRGRWFELPPAYLADPRVDSGLAPYRPLPVGFRFAGGVGGYVSFVHIDTRGINAGWTA